jgi:hypothetical protein
MEPKKFKVNKDVLFSNLLGRKMIMGFLGIIIPTVLVCCSIISESVFETCFITVIGMVLTGNIAQRYVESTSAPKSPTEGQDVNTASP